MSNITGRINLAQLQHVVEKRKTKGGEMIDVITIPIKNNKLFLSEKGNVFLDLVAFEVAPEKRKTDDTHLVKQSFSKEEIEKMSDAQKKDIPILGNLRVWGQGSGEPAPNTPAEGVQEPGGDLPF